jgi:hypothetical protein
MVSEKYNPQDEYKISINSEIARRGINSAREAYRNFADEHMRVLDLRHPASIPYVFEAALGRGIFDQARDIRQMFFGKDIYFYGVSYLWDMCIEKCIYCPGSIENRRNIYRTRQMSIDEAVDDTRAVMADGHTHICYLTGEDPHGHPTDVLAKYLEAFDELGLDEIILNIDPKTVEDFLKLRKAVKHTPLQFRVFQETYDMETYKCVHPLSTGLKPNYSFRRQSQARAIEAGFDSVGVGILFGLHRFPIEDIEGIRIHVAELKQHYGTTPARVCLPSATFLSKIGVTIPFVLEKGKYLLDGTLKQLGPYEMASELLYSLSKLALPTICLVSSERDPKGLLQRLDNYASCTTLNVHPGVGDNIRCRYGIDSGELHFQQAVSFSRDPEWTLKDMTIRGFRPVIGGLAR